MTRVLIPTRNRPASLLSVIRFLEKFYPGTELIVADGSSLEHGAVNAANMTASNLKVSVDYRKFPYDMPFFERILDVLAHENDEYLIMGSDDDYPLMDGLKRVYNKLKQDPDASTGLGATLHFTLKSRDDLTARLGFARPLMGADAEARARNFSMWPFSTTYAVTRRELLIERFNRSRDVFLPGFYDFGVGVHDSFLGKMHAIPEFTFVATRNFNHSYLRPDDPLLFVRRSEDFFKLAGYIESDIRKYTAKSTTEVAEVATRLLLRRVAAVAGAPPQRVRGFESSRAFGNPIVQRQFALYRDVFKKDSPAHESYEERLRFIVEAMRSVSTSSDNAGEATTVESLESQMASSTAGENASHSENQMFKPTNDENKRAVAVRNLVPGQISIHPDTLLNLNDSTATPVHILAIGQSNASNHGQTPEASAFGNVTNADGNLLPMSDPIPGGSGEGGSVWPRLAELVNAQNLTDEFVVTLRAVGGTSMADWSKGGEQYIALEREIGKVSKFTPQITHILWHQGERDTLLETKQDAYAAGFETLHALISRHLPDAKWIICKASYRMGKTNPGTILAQNAIIEQRANCFDGPNTDLLREEYRYDNTHFNSDGLSEFARMLSNSLIRATH